MASGEMNEAEFRSFLADTLGTAVRVSRNGALRLLPCTSSAWTGATWTLSRPSAPPSMASA